MDGGTQPLLRLEASGGVATLTLARPAARNALSMGMIAALRDTLARITADDTIRCVILAADGPVFCAGHDLRELTAHRADADAGAAFFAETMAACSALMQAIVALPQPVIAAVQGMATAAGCQLVATCDLAVASAAARFCTPGVDIGLFCSTPAVALSRAVPHKAALEMLLTGDPIGAEAARRLGLVNRVVAPDALVAEAAALAQKIAARSAVAVRLGKRAFHTQSGLPLAEAYAIAAATMTENMLAEDAAIGIGAFLNKTTPVWRNR
ncbi:enoyl-CoA hydratase [Humitalea sp. 24SJ18S-53]|uniref:enoyl-CoA hydratase n=1 Tax=Humitalea sp. 24SJ18S-53 TaxID=3422307 RepID=UPI003D67B33D